MPDVGLSTRVQHEAEWIEDLDVVPGQEDVAQRISALERAIAARPAEWPLRLKVAQEYASNGDFREASEHLRACLDLATDPDVVAGVFFNLGVCSESLTEWRDAARAYQQCLLLLPNLFWARFNLGTCWMKLEEWRSAADEFRRAAAIDETQPEALRSLRDALNAAGMAREASEAHSRLLDLRHRFQGQPAGSPPN